MRQSCFFFFFGRLVVSPPPSTRLWDLSLALFCFSFFVVSFILFGVVTIAFFLNNFFGIFLCNVFDMFLLISLAGDLPCSKKMDAL